MNAQRLNLSEIVRDIEKMFPGYDIIVVKTENAPPHADVVKTRAQPPNTASQRHTVPSTGKVREAILELLQRSDTLDLIAIKDEVDEKLGGGGPRDLRRRRIGRQLKRLINQGLVTRNSQNRYCATRMGTGINLEQG